MATQTTIIMHSDVSGEIIERGKGETLAFSIDGTAYTIDLTSAEAEGLRQAVAPYIAAARRVAGRPRVRAHRSRPSKPDLNTIRVWAEQHGYKVSSRGRIAQSVLNAYDESRS